MDLSNFWWQSGGPAGASIGNSLRFRGGQHLSRTFSGACQDAKRMTISLWTKRANLSSSGEQPLISGYDTILFAGDLVWKPDNTLAFRAGGTSNDLIKTTAIFRDPSAWYHIVIKYDSTQATAAERQKIYVNGIQQAVTGTYPALNHLHTYSCATPNNHIGAYRVYGTADLNGYESEIHFIDGTALAPTDFGEFNADGVWVPKKVTGLTYGANGFYLAFDDVTQIGKDSSGNNNHFTATGFELTDTTSPNYDWVKDSPTDNYSTLNPIGTTYGFQAPTDGNLSTSSGTNGKSTEGTFAIPQDGNLYYFEGTMTHDVGDGGTGIYFGVHTQGTTNNPIASNGKYLGIYGTDGSGYDGLVWIQEWFENPDLSRNVYGHINAGTVWSCAVKYVSGTWKFYVRQGSGGWWYYNGSTMTYLTTFDETKPSASYATSDTLIPIGNNIIFNFGQRPFKYTPPAGFLPLSTAGLPDVPIKNPSDHFTTILDTGANILTAAQAKFPNGLWWIKDRANSNQHQLVDSVRGGNQALTCPNLAVETAYVAPSGNSVAWCWATPGNPHANTDGTIPSQVDANQPSGFSIVTYTGTNVNATVGHGLSLAPEFILTKSRSSAVHSWYTYHASIGASSCIYLNYNAAASSGAPLWNGNPTNTAFTLGTSTGANETGINYVAYCWHSVPGYSAFGKYQANGTADGPFVYTGFRPAWVLVKATTVADGWYIRNTAVSTYNPVSHAIDAASAVGEIDYTSYPIDILSNGFKFRGPGYGNGGTHTYIYAAFAEMAFGGANVSPAPAR